MDNVPRSEKSLFENPKNFFFRKSFLVAEGTRGEAALLERSDKNAERSDAKYAKKRKGLEENFVFLFAFFAYAKIRGEKRL